MKKIIFLSFISCWALQGCIPLVVGGAAATGAGTIHDRRNAGTIVSDKTLGLKLTSILGNNKPIYDNSHLNITVYDSTVLITGEAASEQIKNQIGDLVKSSVTNDGVQRIYNYVLIGPRSSLANRLYDSKLTAKVKTVLTDVNVPGFDPTRVKVVTAHSVTFLLGIVTQTEAQAVTNIVSRVKGVSQVVTLFNVNNELNTNKDNASKDNTSERVKYSKPE